MSMEPQLDIKVLLDGKVVFDDRQVRILQAIESSGTLVGAASTLSMSYRNVCRLIQKAERSLGVRLVESAPGGPGGGSSQLTSAGRILVNRYARFRLSLDPYAAKEFGRALGYAMRSSSRYP